jgi:predicted metal-dependent enzyme (double-stranded beta helix superfamily)
LSRRAFLAAASLFVVGAGPAGADRKGRAVRNTFDVDRFADDVKRARSAADSQMAVQDVLGRAVSDPGAIIAAIGEPTQPGLHTIHHANDLTIINVVWAPFMVLLPHNHEMWASIGIYTGREDNIIWRRTGPVIEATGAQALSEREVFGLPDDAIHSVTNPIRRLTGAIHIYGGDFFATPRSEWDAETLRERPFDIEAARQLFREANERFDRTR